ncbi:MAG TPA: hypothetical protein VM889_00095 [Candidatus Thermoplasmatota archaeon]|nr:hypothetical protein [Candidatus Thermoplasmatota archaeon]
MPLLNAGGGVLLASFGLLVAHLARGRGAALGLAGFAMGLGAVGVSQNLRPLWPDADAAFGSVTTAGLLVTAAGLVILSITFPTRRPMRDRFVVGAFAGAAAIFAPGAWALLQFARAQGLVTVTTVLETAATAVAFIAYAAFLLILSLPQRAPEERSQAVIAAVALLPYLGLSSALWLLSPHEIAIGISTYALLVVIALTWLRSLRSGPDAAARNLVLFALATPVVGALLLMGLPDPPLAFAARGWAVAVLSYGILRHQLLGFDVKVRWTISKSTVAAVFIAVFFVASEAAQQFLGETLGSTYVGIAAAGALVFALAPLQRAAERLAERAVPVAEPAPAAAAPGAEEETYRVTVRKYLADGMITRAEEGHLARLATRLGIEAERAHDLRHEIERALATARPKGEGRA